MENYNKPFLTTRSLFPENQETPIKFLKNKPTPEEYFFQRNHFDYPPLLTQNYILPIIGAVSKPLVFHYKQLLEMNHSKLISLLECAGNNRSKFEPKVYGEQWEEGAISQGEWSGIPLYKLLDLAGVTPNAKEVVFIGYDSGLHKEANQTVHYARSLPIKKALDPSTLIALSYNGKPLSFKHGYPLRLIVPGWYGMASVKWLKKIIVISNSFDGPFQSIDYVYYPDEPIKPFPVTTIKISSIIKNPLDYSILKSGLQIIEGYAWTGNGVITKIEISFDQYNWIEAILPPSINIDISTV